MSDDSTDDELSLSGFDDEPLRRSDIALVKQALRNDWPLAPHTRNWVLREVGKIAEKSKSQRARLAAFKLIASIAALNLKQGALDLARERFEAESDGDSTITAVDVVKDMQAAADRYEREHPGEETGDPGRTGEVPGGPGEVQ